MTKTLNVYQFKISLEGIKPSIWRRIQVPENYNFWDLHIAIQDAMGWEDYHLHDFEMINPKTGEIQRISTPFDEDLDDVEITPEKATKIANYFSASNNKASYQYDFGDSWEHKIVLEKILPAEKGVKYPICIDGKRACPPEDCGGIWGYEALLEVIDNPDHEEYEERMEWLGPDFMPEEFNPNAVIFDNPKERWKIAFD